MTKIFPDSNQNLKYAVFSPTQNQEHKMPVPVQKDSNCKSNYNNIYCRYCRKNLNVPLAFATSTTSNFTSIAIHQNLYLST